MLVDFQSLGTFVSTKRQYKDEKSNTEHEYKIISALNCRSFCTCAPDPKPIKKKQQYMVHPYTKYTISYPSTHENFKNCI